jgi:ABC-type enterochelin transport system ATPase subunit
MPDQTALTVVVVPDGGGDGTVKVVISRLKKVPSGEIWVVPITH